MVFIIHTPYFIYSFMFISIVQVAIFFYGQRLKSLLPNPYLWIHFPIPSMARREPDLTLYNRLILLFVTLISCAIVYAFASAVLAITTTVHHSSVSDFESSSALAQDDDGAASTATTARSDRDFFGCCRGIDNLELWGNAVKWGSEFKFNDSQGCCNACKSMCTGKDGPCLCDTWVFCGNRETCGSKFGEVINYFAFRFWILCLEIYYGFAEMAVMLCYVMLWSTRHIIWGSIYGGHATMQSL